MHVHLRNGANDSRILLALDGFTHRHARMIGTELSTYVAGGKATDLIDRVGACALDGMGFALEFYDVKICDIASTAANRMKAYLDHASIVSVHASMSMSALTSVASLADAAGVLCVGITVVTDIDTDDCISIFGDSPLDTVVAFTRRARNAGIGGIVCAVDETRLVREIFPDATIINAGVRSKGEDPHNQARVGTPTDAILNGADYIVCGRQILEKETRAARITEVERINEEIRSALKFLEPTHA